MANFALGRISVIIANHDYGRFVGEAIESALGLDWPDVEVIVVDDGSTDDSREVIAGYADRVTVLLQERATQRVARNRGYEFCTGDVIIHLDSDDVLLPAVARELGKVWRPGISKVQFQMLRIDDRGVPLGSVFPYYPADVSPEKIRLWASRTSAYPTPPGSGNAYARELLDHIFPLDESCGPATDSACLAVAPFLGDVVTVPLPLVKYRVHGSNASDMLSDVRRFPRAVERARQRQQYASRHVGAGAAADERALRRSRSLVELRVAAHRLVPGEQSLPGESRRRLLWDALRSPFHTGPETLAKRLQVQFWAVATLLSPPVLARWLVRWRFSWGRVPGPSAQNSRLPRRPTRPSRHP